MSHAGATIGMQDRHPVKMSACASHVRRKAPVPVPAGGTVMQRLMRTQAGLEGRREWNQMASIG